MQAVQALASVARDELKARVRSRVQVDLTQGRALVLTAQEQMGRTEASCRLENCGHIFVGDLQACEARGLENLSRLAGHDDEPTGVPRAGSLLDRILGRFSCSMQHLLF